jgi:hypothetical protein
MEKTRHSRPFVLVGNKYTGRPQSGRIIAVGNNA